MVTAGRGASTISTVIEPALVAGLDDGTSTVAELHPQLAGRGLYRIGVAHELGGDGAPFIHAVRMMAGLASESLAVGFAAWCQRSCIHYIVESQGCLAGRELLPRLLDGSLAGATGLSNAMKHLAGFEPLRTTAALQGDEVHLEGSLPWISNLQPGRFVVAIVGSNGEHCTVVLVPSTAAGVLRRPDLPLCGLLGTATAPLELRAVTLDRRWVLSEDGRGFLAAVRPGFLLLQCGLALGLAERAHAELEAANPISKRVLADRTAALSRLLRRSWTRIAELCEGAGSGGPRQLRRLVQLRIDLVRLAGDAVRLEVEAMGGSGFMSHSGTARRVR
jgi:hypothetical protein